MLLLELAGWRLASARPLAVSGRPDPAGELPKTLEIPENMTTRDEYQYLQLQSTIFSQKDGLDQEHCWDCKFCVPLPYIRK